MQTARPPLFEPLPVRGPWTAVALSRGEFLGVLGASLVVFAVLGGPVWTHVRDAHFLRITVSYAVIPILVASVQWRSGSLRPGVFLGATALLAATKLVVTAAATVVLGIGG